MNDKINDLFREYDENLKQVHAVRNSLENDKDVVIHYALNTLTELNVRRYELRSKINSAYAKEFGKKSLLKRIFETN